MKLRLIYQFTQRTNGIQQRRSSLRSNVFAYSLCLYRLFCFWDNIHYFLPLFGPLCPCLDLKCLNMKHNFHVITSQKTTSFSSVDGSTDLLYMYHLSHLFQHLCSLNKFFGSYASSQFVYLVESVHVCVHVFMYFESNHVFRMSYLTYNWPSTRNTHNKAHNTSVSLPIL